MLSQLLHANVFPPGGRVCVVTATGPSPGEGELGDQGGGGAQQAGRVGEAIPGGSGTVGGRTRVGVPPARQCAGTAAHTHGTRRAHLADRGQSW